MVGVKIQDLGSEVVKLRPPAPGSAGRKRIPETSNLLVFEKWVSLSC